MKLLVWLTLLAFGSLLAQVPAVEPLTPADQCACGSTCGGRCGMPDCALPATPSVPQFALDRAAPLVRPAAKRDAFRCERQTVRQVSVPLAALNARPASCAPGWAAPAAGVPLFREHRSLLL